MWGENPFLPRCELVRHVSRSQSCRTAGFLSVAFLFTRADKQPHRNSWTFGPIQVRTPVSADDQNDAAAAAREEVNTRIYHLILRLVMVGTFAHVVAL